MENKENAVKNSHQLMEAEAKREKQTSCDSKGET